MYTALIAFCVLLLAGCSGSPSGIELPAPCFSEPVARDAPRHVISQGWLYNLGEIAHHPLVRTHNGVDIPEPWGTPVYAMARGVAVVSYHTHDIEDAQGRKIGFGLGLFVAMWHEGPQLYSLYAHLSGVNDKLPYIAPEEDAKGDWQPRKALYVPVATFVKNARWVNRGDLIGYIGYTGLRDGYPETPANPPTVDPKVNMTWDPAGPHVHVAVFTRTPDGGSKDEQYDLYGMYAERGAYGDVFTKARGLILADADGSPLFAR